MATPKGEGNHLPEAIDYAYFNIINKTDRNDYLYSTPVPMSYYPVNS